jgi:hypothetical protein
VNQSAEKMEDQRRHQSGAHKSVEKRKGARFDSMEGGADRWSRRGAPPRTRCALPSSVSPSRQLAHVRDGRWPCGTCRLVISCRRSAASSRAAPFSCTGPIFRSSVLAAMPTPLFPHGPNLPTPTPSPRLPRSCGVHLRPLGPETSPNPA